MQEGPIVEVSGPAGCFGDVAAVHSVAFDMRRWDPFGFGAPTAPARARPCPDGACPLLSGVSEPAEKGSRCRGHRCWS